MRKILTFLLSLCLATVAISEESKSTPFSDRERITCVDESKRFSSWASLAGRLDERKIASASVPVHIVDLVMSDGVRVRGITNSTEMPSSNAVLVIGGNGWSTKPFISTVLPHFSGFDADVYYFDFRGYGLSTPANPTMHAFLEDYREIAVWMLRQGHSRLYLYGFSFGGVVALASFPQLSPFERVTVDSAPSRASDYGFQCQPTYEAVDFLPPNCERLTVMHGTSDWIVPRPKVRELIEKSRQCGATIDADVSRGHPFQIEWESSRRSRVIAVMNHFGIARRPQ